MPTSATPATTDPRHEITLLLRGPVAERMRSLIPALAGVEDAYKTIIGSPELLSACLQLFRKRRDAFAEWLVDADGNPVADDEAPLSCGRSVSEVIGMVVRTGMRAYAEAHFGDPITPRKAKAAPAPEPEHGVLDAVLDFLHIPHESHHAAAPTTKPELTKSGRFYATIKDNLDFEWQIRFFPIYVKIAPQTIERLGIGITRMDSEERMLQLSEMAATDINKAEQAIGNAELVREMLDNNALAAKTVSAVGAAGFQTIHGALVDAELDAQRKWDVLANHETAVKLTEDKRVAKKDIQALAEYLHILNQHALDAMLELRLTPDEMKMFLKCAEEQLGRAMFDLMFGPQPQREPEDPLEAEKQRRLARFVDEALRGLVTAIKQLRDRNESQSIEECLSYVCKARRIDFERDVKAIRDLRGLPQAAQ